MQGRAVEKRGRAGCGHAHRHSGDDLNTVGAFGDGCAGEVGVIRLLDNFRVVFERHSPVVLRASARSAWAGRICIGSR